MASKVGMCNAALIKIKADTITNLTEGSEEARVCNARFDDILDTLVSSHPWNFAIERAELAPLAQAPAFEYSYQFLLPTNPYCLRVMKEYNGYEYKIEGRNLLADINLVQIQYIKRVTDVNVLSPLFRESFSDYLAADIAVNLTGSLQLKQLMLVHFSNSFKEAKLRDSQEGTRDTTPVGPWITDRV